MCTIILLHIHTVQKLGEIEKLCPASLIMTQEIDEVNLLPTYPFLLMQNADQREQLVASKWLLAQRARNEDLGVTKSTIPKRAADSLAIAARPTTSLIMTQTAFEYLGYLYLCPIHYPIFEALVEQVAETRFSRH